MGSLLKKLLILSIPFVAVVVSVNVAIDPANIFKNGSYEDGIAQILINGNNVTNLSNYNERYLQKKLIESGHYHPELLIIGSSRVMEIGGDFFKQAKLMNNGVSMAVLEDDLAIINLYLKQGVKPRKIILGLDPWTLNENNPENRWQFVYQSDYAEMTKCLGIEGPNLSSSLIVFNPKYLEAFSFSYFQESLKTMIWSTQKKQGKYAPTSSKINNTFTKIVDGSITYDLTYRSKTAEELKTYVSNYSETVISSAFKDYTEISSARIDALYKLVRYCRKNNIEIEFLLVPFHPYSYNLLTSNPNYRMLTASENSYNKIADSLSVEVYGSFNPEKHHLTESSFYDEMHCNESAMKKILDQNE